MAKAKKKESRSCGSHTLEGVLIQRTKKNKCSGRSLFKPRKEVGNKFCLLQTAGRAENEHIFPEPEETGLGGGERGKMAFPYDPYFGICSLLREADDGGFPSTLWSWIETGLSQGMCSQVRAKIGVIQGREQGDKGKKRSETIGSFAVV